ncbi:hypothetical protein [Microbacterium sp.]|uniref:hypothetical protein n=1 Tax=Microbacterium sp. TaxID=51671 RepID=UPI003F719520
MQGDRIGGIRRWMLRVIGAVMAAAIVSVGAVVMGPQGAQAAMQGPGYGSWPGSEIGWEGAFVAPDGSLVYCIVPGAANPTGATTSAGFHSVIGSLSPFGHAVITADIAAKINRIVTLNGQTSNNAVASGVSFAVKHLANPGALYRSSGWNGTVDLEGFINYKLVGLVGPAVVAEVQGHARYLVNSVAGVTAGNSSGSGALAFTTDPANDFLGTVRMNGTAATGTVTLTNGVFAANGSASLAGMRQGVAYPVRGVPPTSDGSGYRISGSGTFGAGYAAQLHLWETPGQQATVGPGGGGTFTAKGADAAPRSTSFAPYITTQVEQRYSPGGAFVDHVTFATSKNEWPRSQDGSYAVVEASAVVYRTAQQPASATPDVPADAEPVGALTLTSDPAIGPAQPYRVASDWELPGPGHYTAVWTIDGADQAASTVALLDGGAAFHRQELFGEKTQMTMVPNITSEAQKIAQVGGAATDAVIVADVLPLGGADISTALYRVPDGTEVVGACIADNLVWGSDAMRIDAVGRYIFTAPSVPAFGEYAWQHRAFDVDGAEIMTSECGIASELTSAPAPTVDSRAPETIVLGELVHDVAIVSGPVPAIGETFVTFELYEALPGVEPIGSCTADTLVGDTSTEPVAVAAAGEYVSPGIRPVSAGAHYSIEYLWWRADASAEAILLDQGECGLAHETTIVEVPSVPEKPGIPELPLTGGDGIGSIWAMIGAGLLLAAGAIVIRRARV